MSISRTEPTHLRSLNPNLAVMRPKCLIDLATVSHYRAPVSATRDRNVRVPTLGCRIYINPDDSVRIAATRMESDGRVFIDSGRQFESRPNLPSVKTFLGNLSSYGNR